MSAVGLGEHSTADEVGGVCSWRVLRLNTVVTQNGVGWSGGENAR